jgi:cytoskeleton protein RodZ
MARGTFGERLKRERELREVTPEEVCKATRIAPRFLQALENEQWDRLPGGVFGRGFVRSIARYLGLSEEDLLSEYDLARGENGNGAPAKAEERIPATPKWIPILAGVLAVSILVGLALGGRYAWKAYQGHRAAKKTSAIVSIPGGTQPRTTKVSAPAGAERE